MPGCLDNYSQLLAFVRNRGKYEKQHGENTAIPFINSLIVSGQVTAQTDSEKIADYLKGKFITEAEAEATEAEAKAKNLFKRIEFDSNQAEILYNALVKFITKDNPNDSPERALLAKLYEFKQKFLQE